MKQKIFLLASALLISMWGWAQGEGNIAFADDEVKAICVANWDTDGDGELSTAEAAAVTDLGTVFQKNSKITSFTELENFTGLTSIPNETFYECRNLTAVTIPMNVTSIGQDAFKICSNLASLNIPEGVTSIGGKAFDGCSSLTSLLLPNSLVSIDSGAFMYCSGLTTMTIPKGVTSIGYDIFDECNDLATITVESGNANYDSRENCNAIIETSSNTLISGCNNTIIPNGVTKIGDGAFTGCRNITSIIIPNSVTSIGRYAFSACSNLATITIPNSVKSIGSYAFQGTVWYENLPDGLVYAGNVVYKYKGTMPEDTKIIIDDGTMGIAGQCFLDCTGLVSVTIPSSVVSINESAFYGCRNLSSVTSMINEPFSILKNVFDTYNYPNATLYVPSGSKTKYQATEGWKNFNKIYELEDGAGTTIIEFADDNVKALCVTNWDTNKDGELSKNEAAAVTSLGTVFKGNTTIASFDELQYFSGLTSISENAFKDCSALKSVIIPEGVEDIFEYAFSDCSALNSVTIPESVVNILDFAFYQCRALSSVILPNKLERICRSAFSWSGLTSLIIPKSVRLITTGSGRNSNYGAFSNCGHLQSIVVEEGNPNFDSRDNCNAIIRTNTNELIVGCTNTVIPSTVTKIGDCAFMQSGVRSISIPEGVTVIGNAAFAGCTLTSVDLPNSLTTIGDDAFHDDNEITAITIPSGVTSIGTGVFIDCLGLATVTSMILEPFDVSKIGFYNANYNYATLYVPSGCKAKYQETGGWKNFVKIEELEDGSDATIIEFADDNVKALCVTNWDTNKDGELSKSEAAAVKDMGTVFQKNSKITSFTEMENFTGLTSIPNETFYECQNLTAVIIPKNVTSIGRDAFKICSNLASLDIPEGVTSIGGKAFDGCSSLTSLLLPNSLVSIDDGAFMDCSGLTTMTIPKGVKSIGYSIFYDCGSLATITVESGNANYDSRENCNAIIETSSNTLISGCKNTIIPNGVTKIADAAFHSCTGLTTINLPSTVTSIGSHAFWGCSSLASVTIPSSVTNIGDNAFDYCNNLTSVTVEIQEPLTIGEGTFSNRANAIVFVPKGCKEAYSDTDYWKEFKEIAEFTNDEEITYLVNEEEKEVVVGGTTEEEESVEIPESVTIDGEEYDVTGIAPNAFEGNETLKEVSIPATVTSIGENAFGGCKNLSDIWCYSENPIELGNKVQARTRAGEMVSVAATVFAEVDLETCVLHVPAGSKELYEAAEGWGEFANIVEIESGTSTEVTIKITEKGKSTYCSEYDLDFSSFGDNLKAYVATGYNPNTGTIWMTRVMDVPAGTGIFLKGNAGDYNVPITTSKSYYRNMMDGTVEGCTIPKSDGGYTYLYLTVPTGGSELAFCTLAENSKALSAHKAYLKIPKTFTPTTVPATDYEPIEISEYGKSTYCSSNDLDFSKVSGLSAYVATGYSNNTGTIWMTRVNDVPAGTGVFLKGTPGMYHVPTIVPSSKTMFQSVYENMMVGTLSGTTIPSTTGTYKNMYLTVEGGTLKFCGIAGDSRSIGANKAYLQIPLSVLAKARGSKTSEEVVIDYSFSDEVIGVPVIFLGEATAIQSIGGLQSATDRWYNLKGQRVEDPGKGLYIKNGKKIVIK